jgi:hypothetical protein
MTVHAAFTNASRLRRCLRATRPSCSGSPVEEFIPVFPFDPDEHSTLNARGALISAAKRESRASLTGAIVRQPASKSSMQQRTIVIYEQ